MNETNWIHQDAWWRRDLGDGTFLMVSRTTLNPEFEVREVKNIRREYRAHWYFRLHHAITGEVLLSGPHADRDSRRSYPDASTAMRLADERVKGLATSARVEAKAARVALVKARKVVDEAVRAVAA